MTVHMKLRATLDLPIEAESITPSSFARRSLHEIRDMPVIQGNSIHHLSEFFDIDGTAGPTAKETEILLSGNLNQVKMIGKGMDGGRIKIEGNAGMHLGANMKSGRIHVIGSVGSWTAAEMAGGNIQIEGDADHNLCSAYRGSKTGMTGGRVYVKGNVASELASHMCRGFIVIGGDIGPLAAARMMGGTIILCGNVDERIGVEATRGLIICIGTVKSILPTYRLNDTANNEFIGYYLRYLKSKRPDFLDDNISTKEQWTKFIGDFSEDNPRLEIFLQTKTNKHMS
ncbi:MAG: formylmethanofuran dehydrogenase subunit C [Candidatus Thorarchaeota archaeon]|nr:formylmethanofuran dehydrogenase subunit C [Candidatus Thorarchaeota archaeon]